MKRFRETYKNFKVRHDVAEWAINKFIDECSYDDFWCNEMPMGSTWEEMSGYRQMRIARRIIKRFWKLRRERKRKI